MRVVVSHQIIRDRDHPRAREADAARRDAGVGGVLQSAPLPVPVRIQNGWKRAGPATERAIEITRQIKAGHRLEINLLDAVTAPLDFPENMRLKRRLFRQWPQSAAHQDLLSNIPRA